MAVLKDFLSPPSHNHFRPMLPQQAAMPKTNI
jgi:hypothetical protein